MQAAWTHLRRKRRAKPRAPFANLIASMQERLIEKPGDLKLRKSLAFHLGLAGRYDEGVAEAEKLLQAAPGDPDGKRLLVGLKVNRLLRRERPLH